MPDAHGDEGGSPPRIVVLDATSGQIRRTLRGAAPSWLPDGRLLAFVGPSLVLDGRTIVRGVHTDWDVSPDGRLLAAGGGPIRVIALDGGTVTRPTDQAAGDVSWSPDGTKLAAIAGDRVLIADATGATPPRELTRIAGRGLGDLEWSPDGAHLAVVASIPTHDD
jgi:Tol biopolymer transport system component